MSEWAHSFLGMKIRRGYQDQVSFCSLEGCMVFLPYLPCKTCPAHIWLPLPIQSERFRHQIGWPWGSPFGNFRCPDCRRLSRYWAEDCRWHRVQNTNQHHTSKTLAVHRISVPCAKQPCAGLLHILAVMPLGSHLEDGASLVAQTRLYGTLCDNGHKNNGAPAHGAIQCTAISVSEQGDPLEWTT